MRGKNSEVDPHAINWTTADLSVCPPPDFLLWYSFTGLVPRGAVYQTGEKVLARALIASRLWQVEKSHRAAPKNSQIHAPTYHDALTVEMRSLPRGQAAPIPEAVHADCGERMHTLSSTDRV
ncbi:MAG: hypothetical protein ABSH31_14940 [Bryobacteraceae bacterium]|jgi:hypothetical protein